METGFEKHRHYSIELEEAILGVCLLERSGFPRIIGMVEAETFYSDNHQFIFRCLKEMHHQGRPIDLLTVIDFIIREKKKREFESGDPVDYVVTRLTNNVVNGAHLEYHCHIIRMMWVERELLKLTHGGFRSDGNTGEKIAELQSKLHDLNQFGSQNDWEAMDELIVKLYQHQEEMKQKQGMGLTTGFRKLDHESGGFHPGNFIIIGARPSVGKSAFMGQMAIQQARRGAKIGIVSLEMSNNEIAARLAAIEAQTDFRVLYRGLYQDEQHARQVYSRVTKMHDLPIFVSDATEVNIHQIRAKAEKLKKQRGLDLLYIDYLQLVSGDESKNSIREQVISKISRGAKIMAKEMEIPVVALCQLNRQVTNRKGEDRYPQLSDLRESGSLEQDADVVMFLHRDFMAGIEVDENGNSTVNQANVVVRKWRNARSNYLIDLHFEPSRMEFSDPPSDYGNYRPVSEINHYYESQKDREDPF